MANTEYFNKALKKSKIGEDIVEEILKIKYKDVVGSNRTKKHDFDFICREKLTNYIVLVDVKTKPRRVKRADNGLDYAQYLKYLKIAHVKNAEHFYIYFVDEKLKRIYKADILDPELPLINQLDKRLDKLVIYVKVSDCTFVCSLSDDVAETIKDMSQSRY